MRVEGLGVATQIAVGPAHACALVTAGAIECWGANDVGQLGDGTGAASSLPVRVATRERFVDVATGDNGSCGQHRDGRWVCWGRRPNEYDLLRSTGVGSDSLRPVPVPAVTGSALALGRWVCMARESAVRCAGGQRFADVGAVRALVSGGGYDGATVCALREDGGVWCAGRNEAGQAGMRGSATIESPGMLPELAGAVAIALGPVHGCAGSTDGSVACWGANDAGQRGTGTVGEIDVRPRPVRFGHEPPDQTERACVPTGPRVCELAEQGAGVRVCYCALGAGVTETMRCWSFDPASGEAQSTAAPAIPPPDLSPGPSEHLRSTGDDVTVCDEAGRCRTIRPSRPRDLLRSAETGGILASVSGDGADVVVGRIDRAHIEEVDEVGPVAPIVVETYGVANGRRIGRFRLSFPIPIDYGSTSPFAFAGTILEVWYEGVVGGVELWDPRRGIRLHERAMFADRVQGPDGLWIYLGQLGETLWIREDGAVVLRTAALPPTGADPVLEPTPRGLHWRGRVVVATAARLRVFDGASGALEHDVALPWCRPGRGR